MSRAAAVLSLALAVAQVPREAEACGPFAETPIFSHATHPGRPFELYAAGNLGVLRPAFEPMHLVWAYRVLNGIDATPEEQQAVVKGWMREHGDRVPSVDEELARYRATRQRLGGDAGVDISPYAEEDYARYQRINADAFLRASESAELLASAWKKWPGALEEWLLAQDVVFASCGGEHRLAPLGEGVDATMPARERQRRRDERAYQEAARELYCGAPEAAAAAFEKIAASKSSRWRPWGRLLAARALIRHRLHGRLGEGALADPEFAAFYRRALGLLEANLRDRSAGAAHAATRRVLGFLKIRVEPAARRCELFARVLEQGSGTALESELVDLGALFGNDEPRCAKLSPQARELERWLQLTHRPLWDARTCEDRDPWLPLFPAGPHQCEERQRQFAEAFAEWKKRGTPHWLITALMRAPASAPELPLLLDAARKVPPQSPAYPTVAAWAAHRSRELGEADEARTFLGAVPPGAEPTLSAQNLLRSERMKVATSLRDVAELAVRPLSGVGGIDSFSDDHPAPIAERPRYFDLDARTALSPHLTAARLLDLAGALPSAQARQTLWTAFAKASVVGDDATLTAAARRLAELEPTAKAELEGLLRRATADDRRVDALVLLMGLPVVSAMLEPGLDVEWGARTSLIDDQSFRRNWWCAPASVAIEKVSWSFISEQEAARAASEWKKLVEGGPAVVFFAREAIAFARAHPEDPRAPIALARVVRASKRGCDGQQTKEAREAFRLLHQKYGKTEWARRSPYVY